MKDNCKVGGDGFCVLGLIFGFGWMLWKICIMIKLIGKMIRFEMIFIIICIDWIKIGKVKWVFDSLVKFDSGLYCILVVI